MKIKYLLVITMLLVANNWSLAASMVDGTTNPQPLSSLTEPYVQYDDISTVDDRSMYSAQNIEDIIIMPNSESSVEYNTPDFTESGDFIIIELPVTLSGDNFVIYRNIAYFYDKQLKYVDMRIDINSIEKVIDKDNAFLKIRKENIEEYEINWVTNNVNVDLSVSFFVSSDFGYVNGGEQIKNRNVELLWEDFDVNMELDIPKDAIEALIIPTSPSCEGDNMEPEFYYCLQNLVADPSFIASYIDTDTGSTEINKEERLGYVEDDSWLGIVDRWYTPVRYYDGEIPIEEIINSPQFENIQTLYAGVSDDKRIMQFQNAPGQNVMTILKLQDGIINLRLTQASQWSSHAPSTNNIYIASPLIADTTIEKAIAAESGQIDGVVEDGETISYEIEVTNESSRYSAVYIPIRDNLLEQKPDYITEVIVDTAGFDTIGSLQEGDFIISDVPPGESVALKYDVVFGEIPDDRTQIINMVTDDGQIENCKPEHCSEVVIPVYQPPSIAKEIIDESISIDATAQSGETITYRITISNPNKVPISVKVYDKLNLPSLEIVDIVVNPKQDFVISDDYIQVEIDANSQTEIEYKVQIPYDIEETELINIVSFDGRETCPIDDTQCAQVVVPIEKLPEPILTIEKEIIDESTHVDQIAQRDETISYQLTVSNKGEGDAQLVEIRDSFIKGDEYHSALYNINSTGDYQIEGDTLIIDQIKAGEQVVITYQIDIYKTSKDGKQLINIATVDKALGDECADEDEMCSTATIDLAGETIISKQAVKRNGKIKYQIVVENDSLTPALDVVIRDNQLETSAGEQISIEGGDYTGDLTEGNLTFARIEPGEQITIEYQLPTSPNNVYINKASDNGQDPNECQENNEDCALTRVETKKASLAITGSNPIFKWMLVSLLVVIVSARLILARNAKAKK